MSIKCGPKTDKSSRSSFNRLRENALVSLQKFCLPTCIGTFSRIDCKLKQYILIAQRLSQPEVIKVTRLPIGNPFISRINMNFLRHFNTKGSTSILVQKLI